MTREISAERKAAYNGGAVSIGGGLLVFGSTRRVVMLECATCGRRNEADARFCQGCGRAL